MSITDIADVPGLDGNRLSHAYIASGSLAGTLAMATVCTGSGKRPCLSCVNCDKAARGVHPDVTVVDRLPDKREILVSQIRELRKDVIGVASESEKRAYLINYADRMNSQAQNAFLQILEEPPAHVVFILKTSTPAKLLPTIRSRCVILKARGEPDDEIAVGEGKTTAALEMAHEFIKALGSGNVALAGTMFRLEKLDRAQFAEFLMIARELVVAQASAQAPAGKPASKEALSQAYRLLERAGIFLDLNVNVGHISGMICANLIRTVAEKYERTDRIF